jgi:hypothetical protein
MRRFRNGEDTRYLPLTDRKLRLRRVLPKRGERLLYCDHVERHGVELFGLACEKDPRVSSQSGKAILTLRNTRSGSRFATTRTRSGLAAKSFSNGSAMKNSTFSIGINALWPAKNLRSVQLLRR